MNPYFDIKLVRKLQEEVTCESEGPIDTGDGFGKLCKECYKPIKDCICKKDIPEAKSTCTRCSKPLTKGNRICPECGYMNKSKVTETVHMQVLLKMSPQDIAKKYSKEIIQKTYDELVNEEDTKDGASPEVKAGLHNLKVALSLKESKVNESEWFAKEELVKLKARLDKVRKLYRKYKDNDKYKREGVSLEKDIKELEQKIKDMKEPKEKAETSAELEQGIDSYKNKKESDPETSAELEQGIDETEVKEDVETMPETEPITKPDTQPDKKPMPRVPNWPQPNVNPKPKAQRTPSQEAFIKARESRIVKVK